MTARKSKRPRRPPAANTLRVTNPDAAAVDVHADAHWVAVPPDRAPQPVRKFGACTADLEALADWLTACRITTVALESTSVYWIPLFELLEARGFQVRLIDPRQAARAPGRPKTDVLDCPWLQRLHSYGLLAAAFRPEDPVCVLRSYLRQRRTLLDGAGQHIQHMQKALEQMNVKLTEVVSDITGTTGMGIIKAILAGGREPARLAQLRHPRCQASEEKIARALQGNWRIEHLFALRQAVDLYEFYRRQIQDCEQQIQAQLDTFADKSAGKDLPPRSKPGPKSKRHTPAFDARLGLFGMAGVDLTAIEGIDETTALVVLSEIGTDMGRWPSEKHFASWLGLCPQVRLSGGKVKSSRVRRGANRAGRALRMAASSLHHSKSALGAFFRRLKARLGASKAIVATAHKLARLVYRLLKHGEEYVAHGMEEYETKYRVQRARSLARQARELGFELVAAGATGESIATQS
jgi:transposase